MQLHSNIWNKICITIMDSVVLYSTFFKAKFHTKIYESCSYNLLCNPKFVYKNNRYFDLSSIYFLYPLASIPKMVIPEMPASIEQS